MILNDLELIAIHIKKTAGMSFKKILRREYRRNYYRMNINPSIDDRQAAFENHLAQIPETTRVIHGHFYYQDAEELVKSYPDVPVVTWLREPVQRVVSSYYFSKRKFEEGLREDKPWLGGVPLLEFAANELVQNEMSRVLKGAVLSELGFIGLLEHLEEDMDYLSKMLGWREFQIPNANTNIAYKSKFPSPTAEELEEIARLNQADIELYQAALMIRSSRPELKSASK